ncbi:MAG: hypothetical protein ACK4Q5_14495 [Saprospiraceae bacterium]
MRNNHLIPAFLFVALVSATVASAQNDVYKNNLNLHVGPNIFMLAKSADFTPNDTVGFSSANGFGTPTFQIAYDRAITKWFSIGAAYGYNSFGAKFNDLTYKDGEEVEEIGDVKLRIARNSFNIRPLFHYANNGKLDLYSGFRLGFSLWTARATTNLTDEQLDEAADYLDKARVAGVLPQFAITAFGLRAHFTENLGAGFELNIGSPYLCSVGVDYRF